MHWLYTTAQEHALHNNTTMQCPTFFLQKLKTSHLTRKSTRNDTRLQRSHLCKVTYLLNTKPLVWVSTSTGRARV